MRKSLLLLLTLVMCISSMSVAGVATGAEPVEFSFWTHVEQHVNWWKWAEDTWNTNHPEQPVKFNCEVVPDMAAKLMVLLNAGEGAPDFADIVINDFSSFLRGEEIPFVPLTDIIEPVKENFVQARLDNYLRDGDYYAVDWHVGAAVMYYNTELLEQAGIDYKAITTMDDFKAAGKKFVEATDKPWITFETDDPWSFYGWVSQLEGDYFDVNGRCTLNSAENVRVLTWMRELIDEGIAIVTPGGWYHSEEWFAFFNNGGAACIQFPVWYMGRFTDYMPDLQGKIKIALLPRWDEGGHRSAAMGGTGTAISKQCKNIDLAKRFMAESKLGYEGNVKYWTVLGFDPIRWDTWNDEEVLAENKYTQYFEQDIFPVILEAKDEFAPTNMPLNFSRCLKELTENVFFQVLDEKSLTPEEALTLAAEAVNGD